MFTDLINPLVFFISLSIGLFFAYISTPVPDVVIKYPTPENAGKVMYMDSAKNCYKYRAKAVKCPKKKKAETMPIQHVSLNGKKNEGVIKNFQLMMEKK